MQAERKRQRATRPIEEIRAAENKATYGDNSNLERDVANAFAASDESIYVMNDSVRADLCGFFYKEEDETLALPIQLKTTAKQVEGNENAWRFKQVRGYTGMVVVCWRDDQKDGWVYDGATLDSVGSSSTPHPVPPPHLSLGSLGGICVLLDTFMRYVGCLRQPRRPWKRQSVKYGLSEVSQYE